MKQFSLFSCDFTPKGGKTKFPPRRWGGKVAGVCVVKYNLDCVVNWWGEEKLGLLRLYVLCLEYAAGPVCLPLSH